MQHQQTLKTLFLSTIGQKKLVFIAFMAMVEKILTYALMIGGHQVKLGARLCTALKSKRH